MKTITALLAALALTACATAQDRREAAAASDKAQKEFILAQDASQKPILEIEVSEGKEMILSGIKTFRVYAPQPKQAWVPAQVPRSDFVEGLAIGKDLALGFVPLGMTHAVVGGVVNLGNSIERAGTKGYEFVQAPGAVTTATNTMTGSTGTLGSGSYDATHAPTVVQIPAGQVVVVNPEVVDPVVVNPVVVNPEVVNPVVVNPVVVGP